MRRPGKRSADGRLEDRAAAKVVARASLEERPHDDAGDSRESDSDSAASRGSTVEGEYNRDVQLLRPSLQVTTSAQKASVMAEPVQNLVEVASPDPEPTALNALVPLVVAAGGTSARSTNATPGTTPSAQIAGDPNYGTYETISLGGTPTNVAISANGGRAFVVVGDSVKIVDIRDSGPLVSGTAVVGSSPNTVAASADGTRAYVTNSGSGTVSIIETALASGSAPTVLTPVVVGSSPTGIAVSANGNRAFVANTGSGTVSIIDYDKSLPLSLRTPKVTSVTVGSGPTSVATNSAGTVAFVTNSGGDTVSIIKYTGGTPTTVYVPVAVSPTSVKVSDSGTKAVVYSRGGIISVIDASGSVPVVTTVPGNHYSYVDRPGFIAISGDGRTAFVTEHDSGKVAIIDTANAGAVPKCASFGDYPHSIVALRTGTLAFTVAHNALYVVDVETAQASPVYVPANNNASEFQRMAINANGSRVIAVDNSGNLTAFYYSSNDSVDNPIDGTIRSWIGSLGTTFADLGYLTRNSALKRISDGLGLFTIWDSVRRGDLWEAVYDGVQYVAGGLEWLGRVPIVGLPAAAAGLFLDVTSYAIRDTLRNPPADLRTVASYVVTHPAGAFAGASNGVIGLVANTASHFIPEVVVKPVADGLMRVNNTIGDAVDRGIHNVFSGRWPWDNG